VLGMPTKWHVENAPNLALDELGLRDERSKSKRIVAYALQGSMLFTGGSTRS